MPPVWRLIGNRTFTDVALHNEDDGVYAGLAVTAHNGDVDPDELATAVFDSVNLADPGFSLNRPTNFRTAVAPDGVTVQLSWHPPEWGEDSPWMRMFRNARAWVG